jgi:hypothetical protein
MIDTSDHSLSVRERALRMALKETLAQQKYAGIIPIAPDYETIARRARAIEHAMATEERDART